MKILILLGLLRATWSAPLIPQRLLSASHSNELLLNLNNGQLLPLELQGPFSSWIPPFPGVLQQQQQAQVQGRPQFSVLAFDQLAGLFPSQIPIPRQDGFAQGAQAGQPDPSQPQTAPQTQQGPNHVIPSGYSFKLPQQQTQTLQPYPVYMLLPWGQPQQAATQPPPQTGPQLYEEQIPFYTQIGYIPQQPEPGTPGGQQLAFDTLPGTAPETVVMPAEEVIPYLQKEGTHSRHASAGMFLPSTSPKPNTANFFTSAIDTTIAPVLPEEKVSDSDESFPQIYIHPSPYQYPFDLRNQRGPAVAQDLTSTNTGATMKNFLIVASILALTLPFLAAEVQNQEQPACRENERLINQRKVVYFPVHTVKDYLHNTQNYYPQRPFVSVPNPYVPLPHYTQPLVLRPYTSNPQSHVLANLRRSTTAHHSIGHPSFMVISTKEIPEKNNIPTIDTTATVAPTSLPTTEPVVGTLVTPEAASELFGTPETSTVPIPPPAA
ncbi:kappa-casein [Ctenodactylus gundi]